MSTATHEHTAHGTGTPPGAPPAIDPERDIDATATILWLVIGLVFVVVTLWILSAVFDASLRDEQFIKIDSVPATELSQFRAAEAQLLANPTSAPAAVGERPMAESAAALRAATDEIIRGYVR